jgi:hypothetical protein
MEEPMNRIHDRKAAPRRGTRGSIARLALAALVVAGALGGKCEGKPAEFYQLIGVPVPGTGDIFGRVTVDGTGRSGVTVTLRRAGQIVSTTTTDSGGNYEFNDLDPGTYTVSIASISGANCPGEQTAVVLEEEGTRVDFACTIPPPATGTVTGRVVVGGQPQPGAQVVIPGRPAVTTDASGLFTITQVPVGTQTITTTLTNHTCPPRSANVAANQTFNVGDIVCTPNPGTLIVNVVLSPANTPISGASVTATGPGGTLTGTTNASGSVTFTNVTPGQYTVSATASNVSCSPTTAAVNPGQTATATVPCTSTPGDFTVGLNNPPPGWNHPAGATESVECKVITTNPARPGATWTATITGPAAGDPPGSPSGVIPGEETKSGVLDENGRAELRVRIRRVGTYTNVVTVTSSGVSRGATATVTVTGAPNTCPSAASSARFKRGVTALLPDGATLLGLRPVAFRYLAPYGDPSVPQVGLIAEEVARLYPEAVALDAGGRPAGIYYGTLTGLLIQEMESRISRAVEAGIERVTGTP